MPQRSDTFGLELDRIPVLNLRLEFNEYHALVRTAAFARDAQELSGPIYTPLFVWNTMPEGLLTLILQRAILGLEAYLPGTVYVQLGGKPHHEEQVLKCVADPARLGRSIANSYFNRLPALINPAYTLEQRNPELWDRTHRLYNEVRNPIFHGWQLASTDIPGLTSVMEHIEQLYAWIDSWHDPELWMRGARRLLQKGKGGS